jgi:hypothetical protein
MISTRKDEILALVELLESGEHETAEELAKAVFRKSAELLAQRDGFGVAIGLPSDGMQLCHGMYYSILDAKRTVREAEARGLRAFIAPLLGAANALPEEVVATHKRCTCGHPQALHGAAMKPKAMTSLGCGVYHARTKIKCPCGGYEAAK